jgi:hypothetical protein
VTLFIHEVHQVAGAKEDEFDTAYREGWMPTLAKTPDARLLWFMRLAHGSGAAYTVVTVTGVSSARAWGDLDQRLRTGDLRDWADEVDAMRHGSTAKILAPLPWSPLQEIDLSSVPTDGEEHEPTIYMEDTAWPFAGGLSKYVAKAGTLYQDTLKSSSRSGRSILEMEAAFQPLLGTAHRTEVVLWQKVVDQQMLLHLLGHDTPPDKKVPGTWMHDALAVRDQWESRLLRTVIWSPRF